MGTDLTPSLNFTAHRHRPVKQRVEPCDAHTAHGWFDVFEKSLKTSDNLSRIQIFGYATEFLERYSGFACPGNPRRWLDLFRSEFALQSKQHIPLVFIQLAELHRHHCRRLIRFAPGLNRFASTMPNAECENSFCRHETKTLRANVFRQQVAIRWGREPLRSLQ